MAVDLEKIVKIIFQGDDQLSTTINSLGKGLDQFSYKVTDATQPLADLTKNILAIDAALAALAVGGLYIATDQAGKFSGSFNEIATLLQGVSETGLEDFKDDIKEFASESTSSLEDINEAIYQSISAGTDYKNSVDLVKQSETLAVATKGSLSDSVRLLTQTINSLGAENVTAEQAADLYFTTIQGGVTRIDELAASLGKVLPVAAALNVPLETVSASMIALTKAGLSTSEAVTSLNSLFTAFLKPTAAANDILGENADLFSATAVQSKGFEQALWDVVDAVDGDITKLQQLVGRKEAFLAATLLGIDANKNFANALDLVSDAAGRAAEAYEKMAQNYELINQNLINNLRLTLIEIGEPLLDDWANIAGGLAEVFKGLQVEIDAGAFDPVFNLLDEFSGNINEFLVGVAEALPEALSGINWDDFIQSLRDLGTAAADLFADLFGDIDLTTPEGLASAIQKVVDGATLLINVTSGIIDAIGPFIDKLREWADALLETDAESQKFIGNILGTATAINTISQQIPKLTDALNLLSGSIGILSLTRLPALIKALTGAGALGPAIGAVMAALGPVVVSLTAFGATVALGAGVAALALGDDFETLTNDIKNLAFELKYGWNPAVVDAMEKQAAHTTELGKAAVEVVKLIEKLDGFPDEAETEVLVKGTPEYQAEVDKILTQIQSVPAEKSTTLSAEANEESARQARETIEYILIGDPETGEEIAIPFKVKPDEQSITDTKNKIDEDLPSEKLMEIKLQGDIDIELEQIKQNAETLRTYFEWEAKIEITEIEENLETIRTLSDNITEAFVNTGDVISSIIGDLGGLSASEYLNVIKILEAENARRDDLLAKQLELTDAEIAWLNARTDALTSGEGGVINITAEGVYPELEIVLQKIIERAQIQANAEGYEYLLGG